MDKNQAKEFDKECSWCDKLISEYYWQNIVKGFCSLDCTNEYLESEGFNPISGPDQYSSVKEEYSNI